MPGPLPVPSGSPTGRILTVDDEDGICRLVARVLRPLGHTVDTVASVGAALDRLARDTYDVALIDLNMPGRTGLDLIAAIVADANPVLPILLTGTTDVGAAVAAMKSGAFDYLPKPVEPDALVWAVARALKAARTRVRERALEKIASEWATTFNACPDALLVLGADGTVLKANRAAARAAGSGPDVLVGRNVTDVFPGGLGGDIRAQQQGRPAAPLRGHDPVRDLHLLATVDPVRPGAWIAVVRDVTELVRGAEERKQLLRRVLSAQEDERRRIARDLHDGIGQSLVSLTVGMAGLDGDERVARLQRVAADALDEIRRLAHGLRPAVLDDLGLVPALERLTEVFTRVHGVRAELLVPDGAFPRLPVEIESALYRIVQEALANVAKHARAQTVDVVLEAGSGWARASVTDDGVGFVPGPGGGIGLTGIKERAAVLGGACRIDSTVGRGTALDVRLPLPE
ncbi:response regulator [Gemmata sp. JC673]|uniref:Oxygen sensor histidine kinase NreB n=1 Tax=Gemmata algarum TaxID=2975278 RepID=A0ABU5F2N8_9BACT|nr:response regulator [Gemmata algarum]MDY3561843.1 response regulator [Gemmata algarum]